MQAEESRGPPLLALRLSHWVYEVISKAFVSSGADPLETIRVHLTRGISSSVALPVEITVGDICSAVSYSAFCSREFSNSKLLFYLRPSLVHRAFFRFYLSVALSALG